MKARRASATSRRKQVWIRSCCAIRASVIAFDFDGDGSTDLLITQNNLPPKLLKNVGGAKNGWLQLAFKGDDSKTGMGVTGRHFCGGRTSRSGRSRARQAILDKGRRRCFSGWGAARRGRGACRCGRAALCRMNFR